MLFVCQSCVGIAKKQRNILNAILQKCLGRVPYLRPVLIPNFKTICSDARKETHKERSTQVVQGNNHAANYRVFTTSATLKRPPYVSGKNTENFQRPAAQTTISEEEVNKFSKLAEVWWNEAGEFEALHSMNELRVPLIRDALVVARQEMTDSRVKATRPLEGTKILDVGSGGGILTEPLARLGAFVIGVDASEENIKIAQAHVMHDPRVAQNVKYIQAAVEDLIPTEEEGFDAVVASEVVEHVADAPAFIRACCQLVKPGGSIFITTLNKTFLSYALGVYGAEYLLRLVSPGTHDWNKFIPPKDLQFLLSQNKFSTRLLHGMMYNPLTKRWSWIKDTSINYAIHAVKSS